MVLVPGDVSRHGLWAPIAPSAIIGELPMPHPAIALPPRQVGTHDREISHDSDRDFLTLLMLHRGLLGQYRPPTRHG
jgi:hypothetical protein